MRSIDSHGRPARGRPARGGRLTRRRGWLAATAVPAALAVLTATGCSGGSSPASGNSATRTPAAATAGLTISPANGARDAAPGQGITVTTAHGKIDHVTVSALGEAVQAGPDGSTFVSPATLPPSHASPPLQTSRTGNDAAT